MNYQYQKRVWAMGQTGNKEIERPAHYNLKQYMHFGITGVEIQIYWYYTAGIVDFEI